MLLCKKKSERIKKNVGAQCLNQSDEDFDSPEVFSEVCHVHQMFSQRYVDVTSEAETVRLCLSVSCVSPPLVPIFGCSCPRFLFIS